eukprot:2938096-Pyramimonas_sp.AAC.1
MMTMMKGMKKDMQEVKSDMGEAANTAKQAKVTADLAMETADMIKQEVSTLRDDLPKLVKGIIKEEILTGKGLSTTGVGGQAKGKGKGKTEGEEEKLGRTVNFGRFPEDSKAQDIVKFMEGVLAEAREDVEELFAYGKKFAERGGA